MLEQEEVPSTPNPAPCTAALTKPQYIWMLLQFHMLEIKEKLCKLFFFLFSFPAATSFPWLLSCTTTAALEEAVRNKTQHRQEESFPRLGLF